MPPPPPPAPFLDQTEAQRAKQKFFKPPPPPPLSQGLDDQALPLSEGLDLPLVITIIALIFPHLGTSLEPFGNIQTQKNILNNFKFLLA